MRATFLYSSALPSFAANEPAIAVRIAQVWLVLGCLAVLCLPALRGRSEWLGWMPLWLIVVPATQLLILRWRALLAASRGIWRRLHRRRARPALRQVRRVRKPARSPRFARRGQALLAAFLFR
jgi:hypothetical protein